MSSLSIALIVSNLRSGQLKRKMILLTLVTLVVSTLLLQEPIAFVVSAQNSEKIYDMPSDIDCIHLVSDTNFTEAPIHGSNGTSNEFSTDYRSSITTGVFNYVELKWEHSPEGLVQLRDDYSSSDQEPASWDYAYFSSTFEWSEEILPTSCLSILEFEVECTGDFNQVVLGQNVFQLCVLLIDSNGKIARMHTEDSLYNSTYGFYSYQLSSWIIEYAWQDMIEDNSGNQEAPTDVAEIRVILAPTIMFFTGRDPLFEGSVTIRCKSHDLQVLADIPPFSNAAEPVSIGSAGANTSINYVGTVMSPNGTIFTLGRTFLIPDWGVIVRWDSDAQAVWLKEWADNAPSDIAANDELIFTVGQQNDDVSLAIWSYDGELLQEYFYNISHSDVGLEICIIETGEIYILGNSRYQNFYTPFLLKLNPDYSVKWQELFLDIGYITNYDMYLNESGVGFLQIGNYFTYVANDVVSRTSITHYAESFLMTSNGNLWTTMSAPDYTEPIFTNRRNLRISKIEYPHILDIQTSFVRFRYSPVYYDSSWHSSIAVDEDEQSIYALVLKGVSFMQYIVVKLKMDGSIVWCKSIENGRGTTAPDNWNTWYEIRVLDNNMICVAGTDLQYSNMNLTLAIFDIQDPMWFEIIDWILIGSIAIVVVVADIGLIYYMKNRKQSTQKRKVDLDEVFDDLFENG